MRIWRTRKSRVWIASFAFMAALVLAFSIGWHFGAKDTDKKAYAAVWEAISALPEPEQCALCDGMRYHAPCIVDLSTGEIGEMEIYTPHRRLAAELAPEEEQQTGTLNFRYCAGLMVVADTCNHTAEVILPKEYKMMSPGFFCEDCRLLLASVGYEGYALVDLYDKSMIKAFPIHEGEVYTIRDYVVSINNNHNLKALEINVRGLLYQN